MSLELSGTTPAVKGVAGSVSAPAITGDDADTGISFPAANTIKFSTNGVERMSITDSGVTGVGGLFASYAIIRDEKSNADGGTFTSGDWRTRDLNTEVVDADGIVSISSNQFTLQAGSYLIKAVTPAYESAFHQNRLYNITDSSVVDTGSSAYTKVSSYVQTNSILISRFTIASAKVFEVQHRCETTKASQGFGVRSSAGFTTAADIYTIVEIYKES